LLPGTAQHKLQPAITAHFEGKEVFVRFCEAFATLAGMYARNTRRAAINPRIRMWGTIRSPHNVVLLAMGFWIIPEARYWLPL
jgi:hypothetical protein